MSQEYQLFTLSSGTLLTHMGAHISGISVSVCTCVWERECVRVWEPRRLCSWRGWSLAGSRRGRGESWTSHWWAELSWVWAGVADKLAADRTSPWQLGCRLQVKQMGILRYYSSWLIVFTRDLATTSATREDELRQAANDGDIKIVRKLLAQEVNVNAIGQVTGTAGFAANRVLAVVAFILCMIDEPSTATPTRRCCCFLLLLITWILCYRRNILPSL